MKGKNCVFIASSLDGKIADKNNGLDWLTTVPNPENEDAGYGTFIKNTDAIVMGRSTFETVDNFDIEWPYTIPVFVLSNTLTEVPKKYMGKVKFVSGDLKNIIEAINNRGYMNLYIDGGKTIQSFLSEDLIDELTVTKMPILLGGGVPLFSDLPKEMVFEHRSTKVFLEQMVQSFYVRKR